MDNYDIPTNVKWTNENSRGSISYLIDVYQDPQNLALTGFIRDLKGWWIRSWGRGNFKKCLSP